MTCWRRLIGEGLKERERERILVERENGEGMGRVQVKEEVVESGGVAGKGCRSREEGGRGVKTGGRDALDASEREESEGLPHAVPARAAYHPP